MLTILAIILGFIIGLGLQGLIFWGIGSFIIWAFGINFVFTFWHGLAISLIITILAKIFGRK